MAKASATEKFEVRNRWTNRVQFTAEITCAPDATIGVKVGLAVKWARRNDADLRGADLRGADLSGADLSDADLSGADLSGADLSDAPIIPNIHQTIYAAVTAAPDKFDMNIWHGNENFEHACDTTHCRAGWVVALAGKEGRALEDRIGTPAAASLIYLASDPDLGRFPDFYATNDTALADMKAMAEAEAAKASA